MSTRRSSRPSPSGPRATRCSPRRWCGGSPRRRARDAAELPSTVQALLAARLDSLEPFQRRILAHASVIGRTFWEAALTPVAEAEGGRPARGAAGPAQQGHHRRRREDRGRRRAGARLQARPDPRRGLRDAARRRSVPRSTSRSPRFIETRAGERVEEVVSLLAEHYGKAAELARELGLSSDELRPYRAKALRYLEAAGDAATAFYSNADAFAQLRGGDRRGRRGPGGDRATAREAGRRGAAPRPGRCGHRRVGGGARLSRTARGSRARRRAPSQDRRGAGPQGRAQAGDRAPPARHQPDQGRRALAGPGAALRGGRLAVHADRRQHARDLRLGEGPAPRGAPRGGSRGEPRSRHLRARVRAHRGHGEGAREPRAGRRARARIGRARDRARADGPRPAPRELRGRLRGGRGGLRRGAGAGPAGR